MKLVWGSTVLAAMVLLSGCAHRPADDPADPLEPVNRVVFTFNDKADKYALRPVAKAYKYAVPEPARNGVTNFFDNLDEPRNAVNDVLQLKFKQSAKNVGRFLLNTIAGLGGLFDVASEVGLEPHVEDFGQTLGYWGVGEGWYLVLPFIGPSDNRDFTGFLADMPTQFSFYLPGRYDVERYGAQFVNIVNFRAGLIGTDRILDEQFDRYLFIRTAYLQRRQSLVYDGHPPLEDFVVPDDEPEPVAAPATPPKSQ